MVMQKLVTIGIVIVGVISVAVADVLIKKIALSASSFIGSLKNSLLLAVIVLYMIQIGAFLWVFLNGAELSLIGIIQTVVYSIIVIISGVFLFNEEISLVQWLGIGLSMFGLILMNL